MSDVCPDCRDRGELPDGSPCLNCEQQAFYDADFLGGDAE